jgi:spore maturation protein CgeB
MHNRSLDIALFGSSLVSAYRNGPATYYRGIVRALAVRGHRVTFYEPTAYDRQLHRDIPDPPWAKVVMYSGNDERDVYRVLERARDADVLIKASRIGVWDELLEREVPTMRRPDALAIFWDVDALATLERLRKEPWNQLHRLIPRYDAVFTDGGGPPVVRGYGTLGARRCVPIYNALDPTTHYPVDADPRWRADLSLLANRTTDRDARVEELFFRAARALPKTTFLLGGSGWIGEATPSNVRALGHVYSMDHNAFNASARCVLDVAREHVAESGWSPTTRMFEAAGASACVISDPWRGIDSFLEPDFEILLAQTGDDVARWLRDVTQERASEIGAAARKRIMSQHTYSHRARHVEAVLNGDTTVLETVSP